MKPAFLYSRSCFVIDLDGVVYQGDEVIPGAAQTIQELRKRGYQVAFLTNNSIRSRESVAQKLVSLDVACTPKDVWTSGEASVDFISEGKLDDGQGVFVVGSAELRDIVRKRGLKPSDEKSCGVVLAGLDLNLSYSVIAQALTALLRGVPFVACNRDAYYPVKSGALLPGCGAVIGALEGASQRKPDYEIGKPSPVILKMLLRELGIDQSQCIVIGDSLDSDILMAKRAGVPGVWIAHGQGGTTTQHGSLQSREPQPDLILSSLRQMLEYL